ncbi:hypothetical protein WL555_08175 [Staphylococcus warneri]|nr:MULTISPECIES: hypothetical protein [Staphylococcus]EGG97175.1 hypothetical protein SEVCU121_0146 [Staphylococcus warneri VCU121]KEK56491.1 hypothetical protein AQ03_0316 [Staphylococcus warneri Lyso 2 2011]KKI60757.1 hypothetical protein UF68_1948 [Staphylococcus warneri]MCR1797201.1 hypothetical protein [Staphylococcus warneri]MCR4501576.1 hypothetical protein [Staphylococcus warneri]
MATKNKNRKRSKMDILKETTNEILFQSIPEIIYGLIRIVKGFI